MTGSADPPIVEVGSIGGPVASTIAAIADVGRFAKVDDFPRLATCVGDCVSEAKAKAAIKKDPTKKKVCSEQNNSRFL